MAETKYHHSFPIKNISGHRPSPFSYFTFLWHGHGVDLQPQFLDPRGQRRVEKMVRKKGKVQPTSGILIFQPMWNIQIKKEIMGRSWKTVDAVTQLISTLVGGKQWPVELDSRKRAVRTAQTREEKHKLSLLLSRDGFIHPTMDFLTW